MPELFNDVLSWATDLEPEARQQAINTASLPFVVKPLALMPDAHYGMGATIGSVVATEGAIVPSCVGVDIGCGMIATRFNMTSADLPDNLDALHARIAETIPAGVGKGFDVGAKLPAYGRDMDGKLMQTAGKQLGSLGSGNHFVEICLDENDQVWAVLHSGSRGVGNKLAQAHIKVAKGKMKEMFINLPDPDLAYLAQGTPEFDAYIYDMLWAQDYALENRTAMMKAVVKAMRRIYPNVQQLEIINCHHNFTQQEFQRGRNLWITRKGAIKAAEGDRGVIPGSMGTKSYIVTGLGNPASYLSCSHGAGRRMSRTKARNTISIESLNAAMEGKTWNSAQAKTLLDEAPESYKPIDEVMANQVDLVRIDHTLRQVLNYKGC